jgi:hypothetical protein
MRFLANTTVATIASDAFPPQLPNFLFVEVNQDTSFSPTDAALILTSTSSAQVWKFFVACSDEAASACEDACGANSTCTINGVLTPNTQYHCSKQE